jgi:hypothetical protein
VVFLAAEVCSCKERQVIIGQAPILAAALSGFTAFAMVQIHWKVFARVSIKAAINAFTTVDEKLVFAHGIQLIILCDERLWF